MQTKLYSIAALFGRRFDIKSLSQLTENREEDLQKIFSDFAYSSNGLYEWKEEERKKYIQNFDEKDFWTEKIIAFQQDNIQDLENKIAGIHQQMATNTKILLEVSKKDFGKDSVWLKTIEFITESLAKIIDVNRVSIWDFDSQKVTCQDLYEKAFDRHSNGTVLYSKDFPSYFEVVAKEEVVIANNAHTHPATYQFSEIYLKPLQIESMLDIPFFSEGKLSGIICFEHQFSQRVWQEEEINFALAMASNISLSYRSMQLQKIGHELSELNEELQVQNEELYQQQEEILAQRDFIDNQNKQLLEANTLMKTKEQVLTKAYEKIQRSTEQIKHQNKQIADSIRAAENIQKSILPSQYLISNSLGNHFIVFKPRDIVSGDFYWLNKHQNQVLLACVDCSGHGVPGAFMTLIGSTLLDKIVRYKNINSPKDILNELHHDIIRLLQQNEVRSEATMDVALVRFERKENSLELSFAGAKRPLYIVRNGEIIELEATRKSVGSLRNQVDFTETSINVYQKDMFYLCSDGFADQNNEHRQSFGHSRLKELFAQIAQLSCQEQQQIIENTFEQHIQNTSQRDDVLLIGVRVE